MILYEHALIFSTLVPVTPTIIPTIGTTGHTGSRRLNGFTII
jgi:hypothetical protein